MIEAPAWRPPAWAVAVFLVALSARAAFSVLADEPLLYSHQYNYFTNGLALAEHPSVLRYVLLSDAWRTWDGHWTIAPLYHLFLGAWFRLVGPALGPLRAVQSVLDSLAAVAVAALGRRLAGKRAGTCAGLAYAVYWPAVEMPSWTMTENLHTLLLVTAVALLARESDEPSPARAFVGGLVLGLSALARSVGAGFLFLVTVWRVWAGGGRKGLRPGALVLAGGLAAILPWTARNVFLLHDAVLIESAAFENIWWANNFVDRQRYLRQEKTVHSQATPAAKRAAALEFALRGIRRRPDLFVDKVRTNFWHFFRPEGLHNLVRVERSLEPWRHAGTLVLDDLPLLLAVPLALVFVVAARSSPARWLVTLWIAYYLFMVVVVFHNEIRYRSAFMPFAFAAAAGGVSLLREATGRRRLASWGTLALGAALAGAFVWPYAGAAARTIAARRALGDARAAAERHDPAAALALGEAAAARTPGSPRPWFDLGQALMRAGESEAALGAYERGQPSANFANWRGLVGFARLLPQVGRAEEGAQRVRTLDRYSWDQDPWLILECAWNELPAPVTDEVLLARNDYGAVRGFLHPRGLDPMLSAHRQEWVHYEDLGGEQPPPGPHRWTRHRAWVRLVPATAATAYEVTMEMGAPFPSTLVRPRITVRGNDDVPHDFTLDREVRPYTFPLPAPRAGEALVVRVDTPVWSRIGEPADQGVRVDRVALRPLP